MTQIEIRYVKNANFQIQYSILDLAGVLAICIGLFKIRRLPWKHDSPSRTLDTSLLRFGLLFNYVFAAFTGAISIFPSPESKGSYLHLFYAMASTVYCTSNVLFIELLLQKTVNRERVKHGRQVPFKTSRKPNAFHLVIAGCHLFDPAQPGCVGSVHLWPPEPNDNNPRVEILRTDWKL